MERSDRAACATDHHRNRKQKGDVNYGQLHDAVASRGGKANIGKLTKYSFPLGRIATAMQRLGLPPLTTIVVKASNGLPSSGIDGFIKDHLDLNRAERDALENNADFRRAKVQQLWDEVYAYEKWIEVMAALGIAATAELRPLSSPASDINLTGLQ